MHLRGFPGAFWADFQTNYPPLRYPPKRTRFYSLLTEHCFNFWGKAFVKPLAPYLGRATDIAKNHSATVRKCLDIPDKRSFTLNFENSSQRFQCLNTALRVLEHLWLKHLRSRFENRESPPLALWRARAALTIWAPECFIVDLSFCASPLRAISMRVLLHFARFVLYNTVHLHMISYSVDSYCFRLLIKMDSIYVMAKFHANCRQRRRQIARWYAYLCWSPWSLSTGWRN